MKRLKVTGSVYAESVLDSLRERFPDLTDAEIITSALIALEISQSPPTFKKVGKNYVIEGHGERDGKIPILRGRPKKGDEKPKEAVPLPAFEPSSPVIVPTLQGAPKANPLAGLKKKAGFTPVE